MEHTACIGVKRDFRNTAIACSLKRWAALVGCIVGLLLFFFVVGPFFLEMPAIAPLANFIEERGIDAGALYYTDIEEFSEANINMENTMQYMPEGNGLSK
jgi:hypothetical protein